jgi:hypothetical protein
VIAFAAGGERPGDPSVVLPAVSWLAYTGARLATGDPDQERLSLVSCSETFQLNAVCGLAPILSMS